MNVLCMDDLSLGQDINECLKDKFSMHKALVYILSWGHVLHAQGTRLYPVLRTSSPRTRHYFMSCAKGKFSMHKALIYVLQDINECLVHGELVLRTEHTWMSCAWITCHEYRTLMSALCMENLTLGQDINECLVHLSSGQVLHAQGTYLFSVLSASSPFTRHSFMSCPKDKLSMHKTFIYVLSP
jgi:hypothetical protein